MISSISLF